MAANVKPFVAVSDSNKQHPYALCLKSFKLQAQPFEWEVESMIKVGIEAIFVF